MCRASGEHAARPPKAACGSRSPAGPASGVNAGGVSSHACTDTHTRARLSESTHGQQACGFLEWVGRRGDEGGGSQGRVSFGDDW